MKRRRRFPVPIFVGMLILVIILFIWIMVPILLTPEPIRIVENFYEYEQDGDFGSAWELFHPIMKEKFSKNAYVTERSHIYMGHYGVSTFSFKIVENKKLKEWKSNKKLFADVQHVEVKQTFHSKFGNFSVMQDVYAVKEKDKWKIMWEY